MKLKSCMVLLVFAFATSHVSAQSNSDAAMSPAQLAAAKELVDTQRTMSVIVNLDLTPEENEKFWPLYEEYRQKILSVREQKLALIEDYAGRYRAGTVDDKFADDAIKQSIKIQLNTAKVRDKYWRKFRRILPAKKAARFYQLENKMDAEIDYVLAGGVPLVETN